MGVTNHLRPSWDDPPSAAAGFPTDEVDFPLHPEGLDLPGAHASLKWLVRSPGPIKTMREG